MKINKKLRKETTTKYKNRQMKDINANTSKMRNRPTETKIRKPKVNDSTNI